MSCPKQKYHKVGKFSSPVKDIPMFLICNGCLSVFNKNATTILTAKEYSKAIKMGWLQDEKGMTWCPCCVSKRGV
jgi:hypothetical protein